MNAEQEARLIAALRGVASADSEPVTRAGQRLRTLMLAEMAADAATAAADDALLARLRGHGVFTPRSREPRWRWPTLRWVLLPSLATALGVGLLALQLRPPAPPLNDEGASSQMRGAEQAQRLAVTDPVASAADLQALFASHHLPLRRVDLPGQQGIELQALLPPGAKALREALAARGISVPEHGRLFLRVVMAK